jgi:hypothetical protein
MTKFHAKTVGYAYAYSYRYSYGYSYEEGEYSHFEASAGQCKLSKTAAS